MSYYSTNPTWAAPTSHPPQQRMVGGFGGFGSNPNPVSGVTPIPENFMAAGPAVMEAGLVYGQKVLEQEIHKRKESILPFYDRLRVYFCVDHAYVVAKLGLLLFPFYPRRTAHLVQLLNNNHPSTNSTMPSISPTSDFNANFLANSGSPTGNANPSSPNQPPTGSPKHLIPLHNCLSFDLYIPLMGLLTYLMLSVFAKGIYREESLGSAFFLEVGRSIAIRYGLEVLVLFGLTTLKTVLLPHDLFEFDILALMGYKYVLLSFSTLLFLLFGPVSGQVTLTTSIYVFLCTGFSTAKMLGAKLVVARLLQQQNAPLSGVGGGGAALGPLASTNPNAARLGALLVALIQIPSILWGVTNPFSLDG